MKSLATVLCIALASVLLLGMSPASAQDLDELTFAAVDPCRIVDTRFAVGPFAAGFTRAYRTYGDVTAQNGADSGNLYPNVCPAPNGEPVAVSINVTAVSSAKGHLRVWAADILTRPEASMVNFTPGENIANQGAVMTWFDTAVNPDIRIYASAATHVVVDVVGYWYPATNEISGGSFQAGGGPPSTFYDPQDGIANLRFLAPPATVTVDAPGRVIIVNSSKAFGTSSGGTCSGLVLGICYERTDVPAAITAVGPGIGSGNDIAVDAIHGDVTIPMSVNAAVGVPPGNYDVGLCGFVRFGQAFCWDRNDAGYTTAFVIEP